MKSEAAYNDSAFLYLLLTAQIFGITFLLITFAKKLARRKEFGVSGKSVALRGIILALLIGWFYQVLVLV
jgi:hypothetical protein